MREKMDRAFMRRPTVGKAHGRWTHVAPCALGIAGRIVLRVLVSSLLLSVVGPWHADVWAAGPPRVRVTGAAQVDAHVARSRGALVLSGNVVDDAQRALCGLHVGVLLSGASDPARRATLARPPESCSPSHEELPVDPLAPIDLVTDSSGRFCVRLTLAGERAVAQIEARGSDLVEGARLNLPVDVTLPAATLRFEPPQLRTWLDGDDTTFDVVASTDDDEVAMPAVGLVVAVANETGAVLEAATTDATGRARFAIKGALLGPPGQGELRARFAGDARVGAGSSTLRVERHTHVAITSPEAVDGRLPASWPDDGLSVRLVAMARGADAPLPPTGTVEARIGQGTIVGAAPLRHGVASVPISLPATGSGASTNGSGQGVSLTFRFVADAPWFDGSGDLALLQPIRAPSGWKKAPLAIAALVVLSWLGLVRAPARPKVARATRAPTSKGRVDVVEVVTSLQGWTGKVTDAHDGVAVASARVCIERRGFERADAIQEVTSNEEGEFRLQPIETRPGDQLLITGELHVPLHSPLPRPGLLAVRLVLRRRALLDRLVATWARRRATSSESPDATPGQVRAAAGTDATLARWADATERAAYGGTAIDERAQAEVDALAPKGADDVDAACPRSL
jgi:hypothetical protein